jgi:hypothetical protein
MLFCYPQRHPQQMREFQPSKHSLEGNRFNKDNHVEYLFGAVSFALKCCISNIVLNVISKAPS